MEKSLPPSFPFCRLLSPVVALCPLFPRQQGRRSSRASIIPTRYTLRESNLTTYDTRKIDPLLSRCASLLYIIMSYMLPHLHSGWEVDQAILTEEDRVVVIRFGRDAEQTCMIQDEVLFGIAEKVKNFAVIYLVDIDEVPDFNGMYELYDACTTMFFYRNKHIMVDLGTGNNNKINWALPDKQELIDIIEIVYRGARKGRGLVVSPKDYSTKYRY